MRIFYCLFLNTLLSVSVCFSQNTTDNAIHINKIPPEGILLDKGWKFNPGDNSAWASPEFDDSSWKNIEPSVELYYLPQIKTEPVGWLRIKLHVANSLLNKPLAFQVYQSIASEIYLDGKLLKKYGTVSSLNNNIKAYNPINEPVGLVFSKETSVVAVRFSVQQNLPYFAFEQPYYAFRFRIDEVEKAVTFKSQRVFLLQLNYFVAALFLLLTILHLSFYLAYKKQKANLYFSVATFAIFASNLIYVSIQSSNDLAYRSYAAVLYSFLGWSVASLFLLLAICYMFSRKKNYYYWFIVIYSLVGIFLVLLFYQWGIILGLLLPLFLCMIECIRITIRAKAKGYRIVSILITGLILFFVCYFIFILMYFKVLPYAILSPHFSLMDLFYHISIISIPFTISLYLSREFAFTSKELGKKLIEVKSLSQKALDQEREKQEMLASQNETLEQQVAERTAELNQSLKELKSIQSQLIQSEKMASLGELTAGIAHEIQNPLNFVNNFSEVNNELADEINNGNDIEEIKSIANDIKQNSEKILFHGKRADAIVKGMLQHSQASKGQKEPTDINALCDEYLRLSYHGLRAKDKSFNSDFKTDFDSSIGKINIIPQDIGRVLLNVINNAFYAVNEKQKGPQPLKGNKEYDPRVIISTRSVKSHLGDLRVLLTVKDNGNGIPQNIVDKIFQPFFTTKPTGEGTGLGLSLTYDIIKAHGGEIKVESKEGEGSEFIIQLPAG